MSAIEEVESILFYNSMGLTPEEFVSIEFLLKQLKAANKVIAAAKNLSKEREEYHFKDNE